MKLWDVTVIVRVDEDVDDREVWEIEAPNEAEARLIAEEQIEDVGSGYIVRAVQKSQPLG